jgi:hypothetical protein
MKTEVNGFTGYESECEIVYFDKRGDYLKSRVLENLDFELKKNAHGNHAVGIISCKCITYDDQFSSGRVEELLEHDIYAIERILTDCVDWEEWDQTKEFDADDFLIND